MYTAGLTVGRTIGAVLGRQNTSSEQLPAQYGRRYFRCNNYNGDGCALNGTAVAAVLIDQ